MIQKISYRKLRVKNQANNFFRSKCFLSIEVKKFHQILHDYLKLNTLVATDPLVGHAYFDSQRC